MIKIKELFLKELNNTSLVEEIIKNTNSISRCRTLLFNIKKNDALRQKLLKREITPEYFAKNMKYDEMKNYKKQEYKELKEEDYPDGIFKCENCSSMKTEFYELQQLEESIIYVYCNICKFKIKN